METSLERIAGIEHGYAQVGGVRLHYAKAGSGERLVLLLHGFPQYWYCWRHQLHALSERYTVVAPDLRGYNLSDKPPRVRDYEITCLVDDVTGLIRHFGSENAAVIGHDWGAGIAWATALLYPNYVWKLGALQIPPMPVWRRNMTFKQALRSWYMLFFQIPKLPEWWLSRADYSALERMFRTTTVRRGVFTETDIALYKNSLRQHGAVSSTINYYRANFLRMFSEGHHRGGDFSGVSVPTLFIYGEQDFAVIPETTKDVASFVDGDYSETRLANAGHWVQEELPDVVNRALLRFLDE
jgi:pimeloyl-ACP methyl ester carboxylesterase